MSQSTASWANSLTCEGKNSWHQLTTFLATMKGYIFWTKVGMTEHQTSRSLPRVWLWASCVLLDSPSGGNSLLRTIQKQTSLCHSLSLWSCLPEGLSHHGIGPTVPSQLWPHGDSGSWGALFSRLVIQDPDRSWFSMHYATLEEACLFSAPGILLPPPLVPSSAGASDPIFVENSKSLWLKGKSHWTNYSTSHVCTLQTGPH
jgi:hypothetical protein